MLLQTIEMDFTRIMDLSEALCGLAESLQVLGEQEIMGVVSAGRTCWVSECADILGKKEVKIGSSLCAEADRLRKMAEEMESRARKMYRSEMLNIGLGTVRIYR